jgi:ribose transport system substrate-binding protein
MFKLLGTILGSALIVACGSSSERSSGKVRIAVIPKGTTHEFWKTVEKGAKSAGSKADIEVIWKGPLAENDRAAQIQTVEQFVQEGVDGIAIAPLDDKALVRPLAEARKKNIPVVIFDSALAGTPGTDFASFVASDNLEGGRLAAREMLRQLDGKSKRIAMLRYQVGSASTQERESGFLEEIARDGAVQIVSADQYGGATIDSAKTKALNMLDTLREVDGIFCPNESVTVGMLRALEQEGLTGKAVFVGFDVTPVLKKALEAGSVSALVVQDPQDMGARAVDALLAAIQKQPTDARIPTAIAVATRANMNNPEIARLLE